MTDPQGDPNTAPHRPLDFVVCGPLRAGTTLLRLLLDHHPAIACVGEFEEAVSRIGGEGWPDVDEYRLFLAQDRPARAKNLTIDPHTRSYPDLVRSMWDQLAQRTDKPIVGCCIHSRFHRVRDIWPGTKLIFLARDPRDVARSCVGMGWVGEPTSGARYWLEPVDRWLALRETLPPGDFIELRYEDLLRNPEHELARCCRLVGHEFNPAMLAFHESSTYEPLDPKLAEQWRRKMPPRTAEIIDAACKDRMPAFGYEPSTPDPSPAAGVERLRIRTANRLGRLRFRTNRYGLPLTLAWFLAKRLPLGHPLRTKVTLRINEVDTRHLK